MKLAHTLTVHPKYRTRVFKKNLFEVEPSELKIEMEVLGVPTKDEKKMKSDVNKDWKKWTKEMDTSAKKFEKLLSGILPDLEKKIRKSSEAFKKKLVKDKKKRLSSSEAKRLANIWLQEEAKGATVMFKNSVSTFRSTQQRKTGENFSKLQKEFDELHKKTKQPHRKIKVVATVVTIGVITVIPAGIVLVAGIIVTIASAGAALPLVAGIVSAVLGGLGLAGGFSITLYKGIKNDWPSVKKDLKKLDAELKTYRENRKLNPKPKTGDLKKQIKACKVRLDSLYVKLRKLDEGLKKDSAALNSLQNSKEIKGESTKVFNKMLKNLSKSFNEQKAKNTAAHMCIIEMSKAIKEAEDVVKNNVDPPKSLGTNLLDIANNSVLLEVAEYGLKLVDTVGKVTVIAGKYKPPS